jgi:hypothetical protein
VRPSLATSPQRAITYGKLSSDPSAFGTSLNRLIQHDLRHGACGGRGGTVLLNVGRHRRAVVEKPELLRHPIRIGYACLLGFELYRGRARTEPDWYVWRRAPDLSPN